MDQIIHPRQHGHPVSMKSGLEDRNNEVVATQTVQDFRFVSMKSGLEDRNNRFHQVGSPGKDRLVSMKSGLEDRNNAGVVAAIVNQRRVSMKSGLEGRNNPTFFTRHTTPMTSSQ